MNYYHTCLLHAYGTLRNTILVFNTVCSYTLGSYRCIGHMILTTYNMLNLTSHTYNVKFNVHQVLTFQYGRSKSVLLRLTPCRFTGSLIEFSTPPLLRNCDLSVPNAKLLPLSVLREAHAILHGY
jgi:hypothetical protein